MVILDELYEGKKLLKKKVLSNYNAYQNGVTIAKYLISLGYTDHEIIADLWDKYKTYYTSIFTDTESKKRIVEMVVQAKKEGYIKYNPIYFNKAEMDYINEIEEIETRLLLFTMMCIYKYVGDGFKASLTDILRLAGINRTMADINLKIRKVLDYNSFNSVIKKEFKFGATRYKTYYYPTEYMLSLTKMGESVLKIDDYRNLDLRLQNILGMRDDLYFCEKCGIIDSRKSVNKKYCKECSNDINKGHEKTWKKKTGWVHPNMANSGKDYYYNYELKNKTKDGVESEN